MTQFTVSPFDTLERAKNFCPKNMRSHSVHFYTQSGILHKITKTLVQIQGKICMISNASLRGQRSNEELVQQGNDAPEQKSPNIAKKGNKYGTQLHIPR